MTIMNKITGLDFRNFDFFSILLNRLFMIVLYIINKLNLKVFHCQDLDLQESQRSFSALFAIRPMLDKAA